ncbi:hypothetical protein ABPG74_011458 [Tetrahymena malaccensis]
MNQVQTLENLKLNQQELLLLSKAYRSCPLHPKNWIVSLSTNPNSTQFLQCARCLSQNPNQNTLDLISIIEDNEKTVFHNWPIQGDIQLQQNLQNAFQPDFSVEGLQSQITTYFENLKKSVILKINEKEQQMMQQAKSLWNINSQVIIQYNQFTEKDNLKKIIIEQNEDFNKQNLLLKETICRIYNNQNSYKKVLEETISRFEAIKQLINFDTAKQINQNILELVDSIDMFVIKNFQDIKFQTNNQNKDAEFDNLHQIGVKDLSTSQLIMKLMSNKMNYCSEELIEKLKYIIKKLQIAIDLHDVTDYLNEDLLKVDFDKLEKSEVDLIKSISENFDINSVNNDQNSIKKRDILIKLVSNRFNNCSQEFLNDLSNNFDLVLPLINKIDFSNYLQPNQEPINGQHLTQQQLLEISNLTKNIETANRRNNQNKIEQNVMIEQQLIQKIQDFMSIFENKTNFCNAQFIQNAKDVTNNYQSIIQFLFLNQNIFKENRNKNMNFSIFNEQQLKNLEKLTNKITELSQQFGQNYYNSQSPIKQQQNNSKFIADKLGNIKVINQLFVDFPILETIQLTHFNKLNMDFIRETNYKNSQQLILEKQQNNNYILKTPKTINGQIMTKEKLDSSINYIFRCKLNQLLKQNSNESLFGIRKTIDINSSYIGNEKCCFRSYDKQGGLDRIIKGKYLNEVADQIKQVEIRVNIEKRMVLFMDYPDYNNVNQMNEQNIPLNTDYSFGVCTYAQSDQFEVEIETYEADDLSFQFYN